MTHAGRVLVCEDEPHIAEALRYLMHKLGCTVDVVGDGACAWERVVQTPPDLLLLDVKLPGLSGWEVCQRVKQMMVPVPVVLVTAYGQQQDRERAMLCGADALVVKPFSPRQLQAVVRDLLDLNESGWDEGDEHGAPHTGG